MNKTTYTALALWVTLSTGASHITAQDAENLPDIGDPAAAGLPLSKEKRLGPVILRQVRAQLPTIQDVELNEYISSLGSQLLSANTDGDLNFHFLLIGRPQINAFATPGGVIAINAGLILAAATESELAGVLAHEITHVTQRHLARLIAASKKTRWISYLGAISAVIAAMYGSPLALAGVQIGSSAELERRLSYSRSFEYEADRIGMKLMVAANQDPKGMLRFFSRLQSRERAVANGIPEFLRTHPLTTGRLSDALNRAAKYRGEYRDDSDEFMFARARLQALLNPQLVLTQTAKVETPTLVEHYRRALALAHTGKADEAVRVLEGIANARETVATGLALAEAYLARGDYHAAIELLTALDELHPGRESIAYHLGDALLRSGKPAAALSHLRPFAHKRHARIFNKLLAQAAAADGKAWLSHKYLADYYQTGGRMKAALEQLTLAEQDPKINRPARELIKAEREKIERLEEDMKRETVR